MKRRKTGKICMGAAALWLLLLCGCGAEAPRLEDGASSRESAWDASEAEPESREAGAGAEGSGAGENRREEERKAEGQDGQTGAGDLAEDPGTEAEGTASDPADPAASADPEEDAPQEVTLVMVGDILLHTRVAESGRTEDGGYDFTAVFAQMKEEIGQADIALVNQEVIIGGEELGVSGYPAFNAPYELGDALVDAGFDVILHATNHALDKGRKGLLNCLAFWEENYPEETVVGIHESSEKSQEICVVEQDGIRIAILNYTYGTNGIALPEDMPYAVELLEEQRVAEDIRAAEELADFTIVCPHWGTEYTLTQTKAQERWARFFSENGADLVIGTHPHVPEPVEWVEDTLVYYSLGNFVNWTSGTVDGVANRMVGGMARVTLTREEDGEVVISDWSVEPLVCHVEKGFGGVTVYPLAEYTEELAGRNEIVSQDADFSLEYCLEVVDQVFGEAARGPQQGRP
ncbi:MAG: CapA family protein [Acetatifactor sp.]|nr:CapA family protein [Acetatifactor sp.]